MSAKYMKRVLKCAILILMIGSVYYAMKYNFVDDTKTMTRITFHEFYEQDDIYGLFVGSSHTFKGLNMTELSGYTGKNYFTLSTSSQEYDASCALVREAIRLHDLEEAYIEISPAKVSGEHTGGTRYYIATDYLKNSLLKVRNLLDLYGEEDFITGAFSVRRNFDTFATPVVTLVNHEMKGDIYKNYETPKERYTDYIYTGKGSWMLDKSIVDNGLIYTYLQDSLDNIGVSDFSEEKLNNLESVIDLCQKEGIRVTLFIMPFPSLYLNYFDKYEEFTTYFQTYAEDKGTDFIDFNLVKNEYLPLSAKDFMDFDHLNVTGNAIATEFLGEYINDSSKDYFYEDLSEKNASEDAEEYVCGVYFEYQYYDANDNPADIYVEGGYAEITISVLSTKEDVELRVYNRYTDNAGNSCKGEICEIYEQQNLRYVMVKKGIALKKVYIYEIYDAGTGNCIYTIGYDW